MEIEAPTKIDPNLVCKVCGEREFDSREGYYYCKECNTKQEELRHVEIEINDNIDAMRRVKKQKIKLKREKPELTSWECYNYILRGMVEELLTFGAKEELKLMTLQIWAAYLRFLEVAFFNSKRAELPKLGWSFFERDIRTLYNHAKAKPKKRKSAQSDEASIGDESSHSKRVWRQTKRKLDESNYSLVSSGASSSMTSFSASSENTASSGTTTRAIALRFSAKAKKVYKKKMPTKHLAKHELDSEKLLKCHRLQPKAYELNISAVAVTKLSIKQLYAILAIALNLIGDDIQLSDLVLLIAHEFLGKKNILQYFPENIASEGKKLLRDINVHCYYDKYTDKSLREHVSLLARNLSIYSFKIPELAKLVARYVQELNLPQDIIIYIERLLNVFPPQMKTKAHPYFYPNYEARAMAYIIFVMKLLFGLDGHKEKLISLSAKSINEKISMVTKNSGKNFEKIFVFDEWLEYIEMRKVILSQHNSKFARQFNEHQSTTQLLDELSEAERCKNDQEQPMMEKSMSRTDAKVPNMKRLLENFLQLNNDDVSRQLDVIPLQPSFTPAHSYFQRLLLHYSHAKKPKFKIPEIMRRDHSQRTVESYLDAKSLKTFLLDHHCELNVIPIPCTINNREYVGMFRVPHKQTPASKVQKADFNITEKEWLEGITIDFNAADLEFKTELAEYCPRVSRRKQYEWKKREKHRWTNESDKILNIKQQLKNQTNGDPFVSPKTTPLLTTQQNDSGEDVKDAAAMHSFDLFSEANMSPSEVINLNEPRHSLNYINLFAGLDDNSDEYRVDPEFKEEQIKDHLLNTDAAENDEGNVIKFVKSNMDCWMLIGSVSSILKQPRILLESKFPKSFLWLLETCAQTLGMKSVAIYEELLIIEIMFAHGIEDFDKFTNFVQMKVFHPIKDINVFLQIQKSRW